MQFDLLIADPPYGINAPNMKMGEHNGYISTATKLKGRLNQGSGKLKNRALNTMPCEWDYFPPTQEYFDEMFRVSKNQIIWGGNYFNLPPTRGIICWDKCQPWDNFSQVELAWTSFDCPAKLFRYSTTGEANAEKKIHPTQKPIALYSWLFKTFAKKGDVIFDPYLGSGSSRIAAHGKELDFYSCEKDEFYYLAQNERYRKICNGETKLPSGIIIKQTSLWE